MLDLPNMSAQAVQELTAATQLTRLEMSSRQVDDNVLQLVSESHQQLRHLSLGGRCQVSTFLAFSHSASCGDAL